MRHRITSSLLTLAFMSTTAAAAQTPVTPVLPHTPVIIHQAMSQNGKTVYKADVDFADPSLKQAAVKIDIDEFSWNSFALDGLVNSVSSWKHLGENLSSGYSFDCVVRDIKPDGSAQIDIIYLKKDPNRGIDKSEHIIATVRSAQLYETTTQSGTKVAILMQLDQP